MVPSLVTPPHPWVHLAFEELGLLVVGLLGLGIQQPLRKNHK